MLLWRELKFNYSTCNLKISENEAFCHWNPVLLPKVATFCSSGVEDSPIRISFHYWEGILWLKPSSWHCDVCILGKCILRSVKCEIYMYVLYTSSKEVALLCEPTPLVAKLKSINSWFHHCVLAWRAFDLTDWSLEKISLMLFTNIINHSMSEGTYLSYSRSKNISEEQSFQSSLSLWIFSPQVLQ